MWRNITNRYCATHMVDSFCIKVVYEFPQPEASENDMNKAHGLNEINYEIKQ